MPQSELVRRALEWIMSERAENPKKSPHSLVDEAGMRFNLTPAETQKLLQLLEDVKNGA